MSKYNLTDILNEYIGGGRIGTLTISYRDLVDKMDELEKSGKVIVRELPGPSGDLKVNREFEVVDRDSAVSGGNKQEKGFTVYDYKFGFDPGDVDNYEEEYNFSVGGNDLELAMELIPDVVPYRFEEAETKGREANLKGIGQLYVQPAVKKEVKFHLDAYDAGTIGVDDLIQAIEDIIFGNVPAPGMREKIEELDVDSIQNDPGSGDADNPTGEELEASGGYDAAMEESHCYDEDDINEGEFDEARQAAIESSQEKAGIKEVMGIDRKGNKKPDTDGSDAAKFKKAAMSEEEISDDEKKYTDTVAKMLKDRILKDIPMDIIIDFVKTHGSDIRRMNNSEIKDEFEEFRSVNYDYIDENLKAHFNRFM